MTTIDFIKRIAPIIQKYSKQFGYHVSSPIIAQACIESAYGTSYKAKYHNYFGLKYRANRCPSFCGTFVDGSKEQRTDGSYYDITDSWFAFKDMEDGVKGYFEFISVSNYNKLREREITDPKIYLETLKECKYMTSLAYVENCMRVIDTYNLTQYDMKGEEMILTSSNITYVVGAITDYKCDSHNYTKMNSRNVDYIVAHYTGNPKDTAKANAQYFSKEVNGHASAHAFVDDNDWYQIMRLCDRANHCGASSGYKYWHDKCRNNNSIGIEMCTSGNYIVSEKTKNNTAGIIAWLFIQFGWSINDVDWRLLRHWDVTHKNCPLQMAGENNAEWNTFKNLVKDKIRQATQPAPVEFQPIANGIDYSPVFNAVYYANRYPDLVNAGLTTEQLLFNHFLANGMAEQRQASEEFCVGFYYNNYADLRNAFGNNFPLYYAHYCTNGKAEGRIANRAI